MKKIEDFVMFIPACGWGDRVAERGMKPFIHITDKDGRAYLAMDIVMAQAPEDMDIEIAVRQEMGCPPLIRPAIVHFMKPTVGQGATIYQWMRRTRIRNYVLISNCDNRIDQESIMAGIRMIDGSKSGIVFTFRPKLENDTRWSYVRTDMKGKIIQIAEKQPISREAVAGVYILNMFTLRMSIYPEDKYLSDALARMGGLHAFPAMQYRGWNDMQQLEELENDIPQTYQKE